MKILVAEDDKVTQMMLVKQLKSWGYDVHTVTDGQEAIDHLTSSDDPPQLLLMDWLMPGLSGVDACKEIRSTESMPFTYIVLLSGKDQKDDIVHGLNSGADDYLSKPYHPEELLSRLRAGERIINLQTNLQDANKELLHMATTDVLTNQLNRLAVEKKYTEEMNRSFRNGTPLCVVMADVDHFKSVNDTYGHQTGDIVLIDVAARLKNSLRPYDTLGRFGGEEFLIILPDIQEKDIDTIMDRLINSIASESIPALDKKLDITASFGAAWIQSGKPELEEKLIHHADLQLYKAKTNGRNRAEYTIFEELPV